MAQANDAAWIDVLPSLKRFVPELNRSLGKTMSKAGEQAGADFSQGLQERAVKGVEAASAKLTAARNKEADAAGRLTVAEKRLQELHDSGRAKASQLASAQEAVARAQRGVADTMEATERASRGLVQAQDRVAQSTQGLNGSAEQAGRGFDQFAEGAKKSFAVVATAAAAAGAAVIAGFMGGMEAERSTDKLAAQLGLDPQEAASAGKVAGALYRDAYGESLAEVNDAVGAVVSSIDGMRSASEADLQSVTATALDFASAFETDVATSAALAGSLIRNGLATDATEAFDLMTSAYQQVPAAMREELPDILTEYGTNFRALGFSGEEAFGLLVGAAQNGQFALDKTGDALKEFSIRSTDMSTTSVAAYDAIGLNAQEMANAILAGGDTAQDATARIAQGILSIEDPAERANTAIALFGTPLEDLSVDQIPQFLQAISGAGGAMEGTAGSAARMGETLNDNFATRMEGWKRQAMGFAQDGLMALANGFTEGRSTSEGWRGALEQAGGVVKAVTGFVQDNVSWLIPLGAAIGTVVGIVKTWSIAQGVLNAVMAANPIGLVVLAVAGLVAGLVVAWNTSETFRDVVSGAWEKIQSVVSWAWGLIEGYFELWMVAIRALGDFFPWLGEKAGEAWAAVVDWFGRLKDDVSAIFTAVKDWVVDTWTSLRDSVVDIAQAVWDGIVQRFEGLRDNSIAVWNGLTDAVVGAWTAFSDTVGGIAQGIADWIRQRFEELRDGAIAIWNAMKDAVIGSFTFLWDTLVRIVDDIVTAVVGAFTFLRDTVVDLATALWNLVTDIFTRARDGWVRIFETVRDLLVGIWTGLRDTIVSVATAIWDLVAGIFTRARDVWVQVFTNVRDQLVSIWTGLRDTVVDAAQNIWDWVTDKFTRMKDAVVDTFEEIRDTVGRVWDGLQDKIKTPIRVVFDFVNDNMIDPVNDILRVFPGDLKIPPLPELREGGLLRGPGTGTSDSILGIDPRTKVPTAAVSNGEYVVKASRVRQVGVSWLDAFNSGRLPGLASGGLAAMFGVPRRDIGGWLSDRWDDTKGIAKATWDNAKNAVSTVKDFATDMLVKGARKAAEAVLGPVKDAAFELIPNKIPLNMLRGGIERLYNAVLGKGDEQDKLQQELAANTFAATGGRSPNGVGGLGPVAQAARQDVMRRFGLTNIGGYAYRTIAGTGTLSDHALGKAIDVMIPNYRTPAGIAKGNEVANYFTSPAVAKQYGVKYVIWNDRINSGSGWKPYGHPGGGRSDTLQHRDHNHVSFFHNGGVVPDDGRTNVPAWLAPDERVLTPPQDDYTRRLITATLSAERSEGPDNRIADAVHIYEQGSPYSAIDELMHRVAVKSRGGKYG